MSEIRECGSHGFYDGGHCPDCDSMGEFVVSAERRSQLGGFLSGALRHFPDDLGLDVDENGWASAYELVACAEEKYDWADRRVVAAVMAADNKGRYEVSGNEVRALYGHSIDVEIDQSDGDVPDELYHGTPERNVESIRREGLRPMNRQKVHLAEAVEGAQDVGKRHSDDIEVFTVDVASLEDNGWSVSERGDGVYVIDRVPPEYLSLY